MPRLHAIELLPDRVGEAALRRDWKALRDADLPSMLDHRGSTNSPHLTVVSAPAIDASLEQRVATLLGPLLPIEARCSGLVVLGGDRMTLARTVDLPDEVVRAVLDARTAACDQRHGWLAHLTLARRLPRTDLQRAVDVLQAADPTVRFTALRRWDPEAGEVRVIAG